MVLEQILNGKRREVDLMHTRDDLASLRARAMAAPPARDFIQALRACPHVSIIAEIKKASPSAGKIKEEVQPERLARAYQAGGAAALSVLTDGPFFGGSLGDLVEARMAVGLPVLRKDFILEPIQLYESRIHGADAVLLIAAALEQHDLQALYQKALTLGMTPLVEVHNEEELERVLEMQPSIVGINNRDLSSLKVSLETCLRLRPRVPPEVMVVAESGIEDPADVQRLLGIGVDAFLIGTALMRSSNPTALLRRLTSVSDGPEAKNLGV
jgi:indole-3-glycerol phosphate synthase